MRAPVKVLEIELSGNTPDVIETPGYNGVYVHVRLWGDPIGMFWHAIHTDELRLAEVYEMIRHELGDTVSHRLRHRNVVAHDENLLEPRFLKQFEPPIGNGPEPSVTVAICTRDRVEELRECLDSVAELDYDRLEILVVDNAPADSDTRSLIQGRYPQVRHVVEPRPGLSWARNRALIEASGEIVAFTDDDARVDAGWIRGLVSGFEDERVLAVSGLVLPTELETETQVLFESYGGFSAGVDRRRVDPEAHAAAKAIEFSTGANMAFRRKVSEIVGLFDPALGAGTDTRGGEDIEMFFRVLELGYSAVYQPRAIVYHPHRKDPQGLLSMMRDWGRGFTSFLACISSRSANNRVQAFRIGSAWYLRHGTDLMRALFGAGTFRSLLAAEMHGAISGVGSYRRAERSVKAIQSNFGPQVRES